MNTDISENNDTNIYNATTEHEKLYSIHSTMKKKNYELINNSDETYNYISHHNLKDFNNDVITTIQNDDKDTINYHKNDEKIKHVEREEDIINKTHIEMLRKLKSNQEINLKRGEEINKNVCTFLYDDFILSKKKKGLNKIINKLSLNTFNLYFRKHSNCYIQVPPKEVRNVKNVLIKIKKIEHLVDKLIKYDKENIIVEDKNEETKEKKKCAQNKLNMTYEQQGGEGKEYYLDEDKTGDSQHNEHVDNENIKCIKKKSNNQDINIYLEMNQRGINNDHINDDHINDDHINDDHINDDHINDDHINDDHINNDHINNDHINNDHINNDHINNDHINNDHINNTLKNKLNEKCFLQKDNYINSREKLKKGLIKRKYNELTNEEKLKHCKHKNELENYPNMRKTFSQIFSSEERERKRKRKEKRKKQTNTKDDVDRKDKSDKDNKNYENNTNDKSDKNEDEISSQKDSDESIKTFYFEEFDFNFVLLGSVKKGSDRHKSLLFKVLCDSIDIPCRYIRYVKNKTVHYFNLVLIPSIPDDILIGLKYLFDNIDEINFLILNFLNKLKKKKKIQKNKVLLHLIDFILNKLFENNLNYRYKKTCILDFYDNLMFNKNTFFESGIINDAINIKDLRLIYFYKHNIKMKKEKNFLVKNKIYNYDKNREQNILQKRDNKNEDNTDQQYYHKNDNINKCNYFVINQSTHILNEKYYRKKRKKKKFVCGEIPLPNKNIGIHKYLKNKSIFDNHGYNNLVINNKKEIFYNMDKCVQKYISDQRKCEESKTNICTCIPNIIVNVNSDARLRIWENNNEVINIEDYFIFEKKLGMGGFGEVWKVKLKNGTDLHTSFFYSDIKNTSTFALKILDMNEFNLNESIIMREKAHTNIIKIYCVFKGYQILINRQRENEKKESLCFLLELADTSLEKLFCDKRTVYNLNFVRLTLLEIANIMSYIHKPNIKQEFYIYRDLKPDNVLIKGKKILITDFNLSRKVDQDFEFLMSQCCGTKGHLAPEQKSVCYDKNVDVWAFSIIISKFLKHQNFHYFSHCMYDINLSHFEIQDEFLINLLLACIDDNPFMRPTFEEISRLLFNEIIRNELEQNTRLKMMNIFNYKKKRKEIKP
ncbi:serine/threonine protein kinase [Plasmodium falciparum Palo Alto/Uganda]|uniref:Serine/threonine protein kinase n=1 Tax=Plasmodium falciparum (isolate Palo Alto / Uganda) TaxID=57270 RepID=W4IZH5_PLAFP|nr:serine/threonine protein kinase [Plasmodium falciparum Palo Alto/Uganda]